VYLVLTTERGVQRSEIESRAKESFGFLEQISGTAGHLERGGDRSLLSYVLPRLFVEIELDWRERAVFVLFGEPIKGKRPPGYYVDDAGRKVRWHLTAAIEAGGNHEITRSLKTVSKESGDRAMLDQLVAYSAELRKALPDLANAIEQLRTR
jgi:hypothetical protein